MPSSVPWVGRYVETHHFFNAFLYRENLGWVAKLIPLFIPMVHSKRKMRQSPRNLWDMKRYFGAHEETSSFKASSSRQIADVRHPSVLRRLTHMLLQFSQIVLFRIVLFLTIPFYFLSFTIFCHLSLSAQISFQRWDNHVQNKMLISYQISISQFIINTV